MEGDKLITYWDDCGNCGEKYSLDGSFIVSPDWSPDVRSSRLQGFHCISSTAAAHALMLWVTAYFVVFSFHFPFFDFVMKPFMSYRRHLSILQLWFLKPDVQREGGVQPSLC